jgi:TPR repeat protein
MNQLSEISSDIKKQLAFTCRHEKDGIPPRDAEADQLYKHARWLAKRNILKQDVSVYPAIERLVRIAVAHGHDKANVELRNMIEKNQAHSADPMNEVIDLVQDLIKRNIPAGYYDMGWYLENGFGVRADKELAFKYYRKSADLGSPHGQYLVGDKLDKSGVYGEEIAAIGQAMQRCAADQGHAKSANEYGMSVKLDGNFAEAIKYYQLSASAGSAQAALSLASAFSSNNKNRINDLGQVTDPEREARYKIVFNFLADYEYLNPKVPELDTIAPLPPSKLPPWDGKFKWLEEHKANVPPPLPTEERIAEMAKAKGLDPKTGRQVGAAK